MSNSASTIFSLGGTGITAGYEAGSTTIASRVFLAKNTPLANLNARVQDLGHPDDGVLLV